MPFRRRYLATVGVSTTTATCGCTVFSSPAEDDKVPGPNYPSGTLVVYNTSKSDLSISATTVDYAPPATFEQVVQSGDPEIRKTSVSAPSGTTVTLKAHVESFAEDGISYSLMPSGGDSENNTPPQYDQLHILGSDAEVNWQARETSE